MTDGRNSRRSRMSDDHRRLVHGAWADGSSWGTVIAPLQRQGLAVRAAPLPLTSLADDVAALDRVLERIDGPVVLAGHAYAGAVIASARGRPRPVAGVCRRAGPGRGRDAWWTCSTARPRIRRRHNSAPDRTALIWLPDEAFAAAFAQHASPQEQAHAGRRAAADRGRHASAPRSAGRLWQDRPSWFLVAEEDRHDRPRRPSASWPTRMGATLCVRPAIDPPRPLVVGAGGRMASDSHPSQARPRRSACTFATAILFRKRQYVINLNAGYVTPGSAKPVYPLEENERMTAIALPHRRRRRAQGLLPRGRERQRPKLLLLHGFPSSEPHVPGPDPAAGRPLSCRRPGPAGLRPVDMPARDEFAYTFDNLAQVMDRFTEVDRPRPFALYVFDYGAPTGFRHRDAAPGADHRDHLAERQRLRGRAERRLESRSGRTGGTRRRPTGRRSARFLTPEATLWQYTHGVPDATAVSPDGYSLDDFYLARPGPTRSSSTCSATTRATWPCTRPSRSTSARTGRRFLAVWGRNDPFFLPAGRRGVPARHPGGRRPLLRDRALRARDACRAQIARGDPGVPGR